jgi:hypothetical protein
MSIHAPVSIVLQDPRQQLSQTSTVTNCYLRPKNLDCCNLKVGQQSGVESQTQSWCCDPPDKTPHRPTVCLLARQTLTDQGHLGQCSGIPQTTAAWAGCCNQPDTCPSVQSPHTPCPLPTFSEMHMLHKCSWWTARNPNTLDECH